MPKQTPSSPRQRGATPDLATITRAWECLGDELRGVFPHLRCFDIGWGEPFCFACGWLAPTPESADFGGDPATSIDKAWNAANGWLERAHLQDHFYDGSSDPLNLVPLCLLCHKKQPECRTREDGIAYVKARAENTPLVWLVQLATDLDRDDSHRHPWREHEVARSGEGTEDHATCLWGRSRAPRTCLAKGVIGCLTS